MPNLALRRVADVHSDSARPNSRDAFSITDAAKKLERTLGRSTIAISHGRVEVDPVVRTPSWRVPLSGAAGEDVLDGIDEEEEVVHAGVPA